MDDKFFTGYRKTVIKPSEILVSIFLPFTSANEYMYSFKQAGRKEDDISIVNAGMKIHFKNETNTIEDLSLAFGGMAPTTVMATKTMTGLRNKEWNENIIQTACQLLEKDLPLPPGSPGGMVEYRKTLTTSFFFKFYHFVQSARSKVLNGLPSMVLTERPLSKGTQVYEEVPDGQTIEDAIGRPIVHTSAYQQATGEAMYVDDLPIYRDELALVHVLSKVAHGTIKTVDASQALSIPGVVDFITYKDVPGNNTWGPVVFDEEMFVSKEVRCQGAIIGAILAEDIRTAERAADLVKVEYEQLDHIVTMEDAIKKNSFHDGVEKELMLQDGDVEEGFNKSDHVIDGEVHIEAQEHFYLETQAALAVPKGEVGEIEVICTTQYLSLTQKIIASLLGVDRNKVICKIKRIGGGFGGKEYRNMLIAAPVAIAANKHNRPVRCSLDRDQDMMMTGTRHPFMAKYKVGFTKEGKLSAIQVKLYSNAGFSKDLSVIIMKKAITHFDLVYNMPNVDIVGGVCKTNIPSNTAFRGFGSIQGMFVTETIMTHIAELLDQCPMKIRDINMYEEEGSKTPYGQILDNCTIKRCWNECLTQAEYEKRQSDISNFNSKNRWRKRGMAINPVKFALSFVAMEGFFNQGGALVHLYTDGSVLISHGGMEMGQGLHTKMIQIASRVFNIPISKIFISETSTDKVPNTTPTATSTGSDLNGAAVLDACEKLMKRLQPVIDANPKGNWEQWINAAYFERVNLSATGFYKTDDLVYDTVNKTGRLYSYFTYGVACTEVEIDCLTGDHQVIRTDIVMDVGRSMNPAIDIGQIEGAFTQGYGMFVIEEYKVSPEGTLLTRGPGNYKIPTYGNIPAEFNVSLLKGASNPRAVYSSKGIGEPPLFLACSALFAIKAAIRAARIEAGYSKIFRLDSPATSCRIRMACQDQFTVQFPPAEKGTYRPWYVDL
ncbi:hypothetical protein SNE40_004321 [Patella caerulea]|uniref:Xanthine dehydrogenase n=1 Tax=Patella caerulea TaxID=87958 RepID=A0AAN8K4J0_PATCE